MIPQTLIWYSLMVTPSTCDPENMAIFLIGPPTPHLQTTKTNNHLIVLSSHPTSKAFMPGLSPKTEQR